MFTPTADTHDIDGGKAMHLCQAKRCLVTCQRRQTCFLPMFRLCNYRPTGDCACGGEDEPPEVSGLARSGFVPTAPFLLHNPCLCKGVAQWMQCSACGGHGSSAKAFIRSLYDSAQLIEGLNGLALGAPNNSQIQALDLWLTPDGR